MFSIIIPLYNKAAYIEHAINSIFAQTYQAFELIVVDDGSIDGSFAQLQVISEHLQQERPSQFEKLKIIQQENQGVSVARNNGVKAAKYDYIAFLDADDCWAPEYLQEMAALIKEYPDAGLYASSYYKVKGGQNIPALIGVGANFTQGYFDYFEAYAKSLWMPVWTGAAIVNKKAYEQVGGFNANLTLGEDFDLWVRIVLQNKLAFLNKALAYYNQDVNLDTRAIGKLHNPENHFLWNLDFLDNEEKNNLKLKSTLDRLRVYALLPYYLNDKYRATAKVQLLKVDWKHQSKLDYLIYHSAPKFAKLLNIIKRLIIWMRNSNLKSIFAR